MNTPKLNESVGNMGGNAHVSEIHADDEVTVTVPSVGTWRVKVARVVPTVIGWMWPTLFVVKKA